MKKRISIFSLIIILFISNLTYGKIDIKNDTRSYLLANYKTGEILEGHNIDSPIEIASISKIMTYVVVKDQMEKRDMPLNKTIIIDRDTEMVNGSTYKLKEGEIVSIDELLKSSMVVSANDSTYALAKFIGGSEHGFAKLMNEKAREIGLENAIFYNATGLPVYGQEEQNTMTTKEVFKMSQYAIRKYPEIIEITKIPFIEDLKRDYHQINSNPILGEIRGVDGLKTGFTNKAGYCNVSSFTIEEKEDARLIAIVMGTKDLEERKRISKELTEYGLDNYQKKIIFEEDDPLEGVRISKAKSRNLKVYPKNSYVDILKNSDKVEVKTNIKDDLKFPIKSGEVVGRVSYFKNGENIISEDIIVKEDVKKANIVVEFSRDIFYKFMAVLS